MTLLAILLALGARALWATPLNRWRARTGQWIQNQLPLRGKSYSEVVMVLLIALPAAAAGFINDGITASWLRLLFDAAVLTLCLQALEQNETAADDMKSSNVGGPDINPIGRLFIDAHERSFGILVWFVAFGPAGAVLYRLIAWLAQGGEYSPITRLHAAVAWVPLRITALLCGLAGSGDDALAAWRRLPSDLPWTTRGWYLLAEVGAGSLTVENHGAATVPPDLHSATMEAHRLLKRTLLLLVALCALFSFGAWLA